MITLKKKIFTLLTASLLTAALSGCGLVEKTQEAIDNTVLAKGDGIKITQKDLATEFEMRYASIFSYYDSMYGKEWRETEDGKATIKAYKEDTLDNLLFTKLIDLKLTAAGENVETDEVKKAIDEALASDLKYYGTEEKYLAALKEKGYTEETYREEVKINVLRNNFYEKVKAELKPTDAETEAYYNENKADFDKQYYRNYYHEDDGATIYHIITGSDDAARLKALEALEKIKSEDMTFEEAAAEYGTDGTSTSGGLLGAYDYTGSNGNPQSTLAKDFMEFVKPLKEGEVSGVVKTQFGYHIIMVKDLYKKGDLNVEIKDAAFNGLFDERIQTKIDEWKKEFNVKEYKDKIQ